MRILSPLQRDFAKAAGYKTLRLFNENAAKITGGLFVVNDGLLSLVSYLKSDPLAPDISAISTSQLMTAAGGIYTAASVICFAADRYPWLKKPIGAASLLGGAFTVAAGLVASDTSIAYYGMAFPSIFTGLSMMFETAANRAAKTLSRKGRIIGRTARTYMTYPVASAAMIQNIGAGFALAIGCGSAESRHMIAYAGLWAMTNTVMALMDNNIKNRVRKFCEAGLASASPGP